MNFGFSQAAREEFLNSIEYYEQQQSGLGVIFSGQVYNAIEQILEFPDGWTPLDETFHRCLVKQFPYALIYTVLNQELNITAVMNLHRKPNYWKNR